MDATKNTHLIVKPKVVLTPIIIPVIVALDTYFRKHDIKAFVTSGLRSPEDQLEIIRNQIRARGLDKLFPEVFLGINEKVKYYDKTVYAWQLAWSKLLNLGFVVNPPYTAECLLDYYRPGSSDNRKGKFIGQSPHATGSAFDIGGGPNGINDELIPVREAVNDKLPGLKGFLAEHGNNAIHCDCTKI